jgi:integrase
VLLLTTGIRRGEGLGLLKQYLNLEDGTVIIKHSLAFLPHKGLVLGDVKTDKSVREIALPDFTVKVLREHLKIYSQNSKYVFSTGNGTPFSPRNIIRHFKQKLVEAGLPPETRIHDLRHSYASWLLKTTSVKDVQTILGHAQASTTLTIYARVLPGYNREAANKIDGLLSE